VEYGCGEGVARVEGEGATPSPQGALHSERQVLGQALDLLSGAAHPYPPAAYIHALDEHGRNQGMTHTWEAADAKDEEVGFRTVRREDRLLDLADAAVACLDLVAAAGTQCLKLSFNQRVVHHAYGRHSR
jgi:hypothetical protein